MSGDTFGCHDCELCYWHQEVDAKNAAKHPTMQRLPLTQQMI